MTTNLVYLQMRLNKQVCFFKKNLLHDYLKKIIVAITPAHKNGIWLIILCTTDHDEKIYQSELVFLICAVSLENLSVFSELLLCTSQLLLKGNMHYLFSLLIFWSSQAFVAPMYASPDARIYLLLNRWTNKNVTVRSYHKLSCDRNGLFFGSKWRKGSQGSCSNGLKAVA